VDAENKNVSLERAKRMPGWIKRYDRRSNEGCKKNDSEWYSAALL
jgi:hypothetical protein